VNLYRPVKAEELEKVLLQSAEFFFSEWEKNFRTPPSRERIQFMSKHLGIELRDEHIAQVSDYFGSLIFEVPPREIQGVKKLIPDLAEKFPLGLISDTGYISGKYIRKFLVQENLDQYFKSYIFSDEQPNSKPHRSVFEKTAHNLNVSLSRLIHIGDLERTDISGAIQAGCHCIKFINGQRQDAQEPTQAHYVFHDYRNFREALEYMISDLNGD